MNFSLSAFVSTNAELIITLVKIALLLFIVLTVNAYLTWFERKVVAHMQSRWGPHRVGPHGLLQPLADGVKFLFKEDPTPAGVDKFVYYLAPLLALALAMTSIALIPFGPDPIKLFGRDIYLGIAPPDVNIGILALFAITAMGVYGVALAGWSSNSKYPLLGGLRSSAQMISYELALTMSVVGVLLMAGSFNLKKIIEWQGIHPERGILGCDVFHRGVHQHDHGVVLVLDHVFRWMAVSLPCFLVVYALFAFGDPDSFRIVGDLGWNPL